MVHHLSVCTHLWDWPGQAPKSNLLSITQRGTHGSAFKKEDDEAVPETSGKKAHTQLKTTHWWRRKKRWHPKVKPCSLGAGFNVCLEEIFLQYIYIFSFWDTIPSFKLIIYYRLTKFHENYKLKLLLFHRPFSSLKGGGKVRKCHCEAL